MLIDEIRKQISEGELKGAINLLQNGSEGHEDELAIHLMQLSLLEKNNRMRIIGFETYNTQVTKISLSILELAKIIDEKGGLNKKIEVSYIPKREVKNYYSKLEEKWANFFNYAGWDFLVEVRKNNDSIADFIIKGVNQTEIEIEVKAIDNINQLRDKSRFIKPEIPDTVLSNCIILGKQPFLSKDGFYTNEEVIQLGWVFNYDGNQWDNIVLKSNFDISNTKQTIYDLLKSETNYKNFMESSGFKEIEQLWSTF
jgi:hypothetical protein